MARCCLPVIDPPVPLMVVLTGMGAEVPRLHASVSAGDRRKASPIGRRGHRDPGVDRLGTTQPLAARASYVDISRMGPVGQKTKTTRSSRRAR
jgi:hypothetical protein